MAQAVCAALDSLHWDGTVGTIAGDDTIFILVRSESNAAAMVAELKKLML
jgi:transcriptional regulator of arginine metabolism